MHAVSYTVNDVCSLMHLAWGAVTWRGYGLHTDMEWVRRKTYIGCNSCCQIEWGWKIYWVNPVICWVALIIFFRQMLNHSPFSIARMLLYKANWRSAEMAIKDQESFANCERPRHPASRHLFKKLFIDDFRIQCCWWDVSQEECGYQGRKVSNQWAQFDVLYKIREVIC